MTEKDLDSSNNKYIEKSKPNDKQSEWDIAIGLQQVDNLKPSKYLKEISEENVLGILTDYPVKLATILHENNVFKRWI